MLSDWGWGVTQHGENLPETFSGHFKHFSFFGHVELPPPPNSTWEHGLLAQLNMASNSVMLGVSRAHFRCRLLVCCFSTQNNRCCVAWSVVRIAVTQWRFAFRTLKMSRTVGSNRHCRLKRPLHSIVCRRWATLWSVAPVQTNWSGKFQMRLIQVFVVAQM